MRTRGHRASQGGAARGQSVGPRAGLQACDCPLAGRGQDLCSAAEGGMIPLPKLDFPFSLPSPVPLCVVPVQAAGKTVHCKGQTRRCTRRRSNPRCSAGSRLTGLRAWRPPDAASRWAPCCPARPALGPGSRAWPPRPMRPGSCARDSAPRAPTCPEGPARRSRRPRASRLRAASRSSSRPGRARAVPLPLRPLQPVRASRCAPRPHALSGPGHPV